MKTCPPDHLHRSGCYQRHKCKCVQCRAWVARLKRDWVKTKRETQDAVVFEPWQIAIADRLFGGNK